MPHGLIASNEHGVVVSADLKNYVFTGYTAAPVPSAGLYVFDVVANAASIYGVRLPVGGQGAVVSAVNLGSGMRVTVLGSNVLGLLVFSPIVSGGVNGYGMALFNEAGQCTFDSAQDHLVVRAAGSITPNGALLPATGDTAIFVGAGIYPETSVSGQYWTRVHYFYYAGTNGIVWEEIWYQVTTYSWSVSRDVAIRYGSGFNGAKQVHKSGWYKKVTGVQQRGINVSDATMQYYYPYSVHQQFVGELNASSTFPYTQSSYNTAHNTILVTDSSLYL